jgi:hypothetical protein
MEQPLSKMGPNSRKLSAPPTKFSLPKMGPKFRRNKNRGPKNWNIRGPFLRFSMMQSPGPGAEKGCFGQRGRQPESRKGSWLSHTGVDGVGKRCGPEDSLARHRRTLRWESGVMDAGRRTRAMFACSGDRFRSGGIAAGQAGAWMRQLVGNKLPMQKLLGTGHLQNEGPVVPRGPHEGPDHQGRNCGIKFQSMPILSRRSEIRPRRTAETSIGTNTLATRWPPASAAPRSLSRC